jgi:uncharacterized protein
MFNKKNFLCFILVLLVLASATFIVSAQRDQRIVVSTGGTGGVYYPLGGAMADIWSDKVDGVMASSSSSGASVENVNLLHHGEVQLALIQNDIAYYAFHKEEMFAPEGPSAVPQPLDKISWLASLYPEVVQVIASANSGIDTISDLKGKRIAVGAPGSGHEANARQIIMAHGFDYDDFDRVDFIMHTEAGDAIKDGHLDAYFTTAGIPTASAVDIFSTHDVKLVTVEDEMADKILEEWPFYAKFTIPAGTYSGQDEPVETLAVMAALLINADVDEDIAYNLTKSLFENLDVMAATHQRGADISIEGALEGQSLELHPGAARYYEEVGALNK